MIKQAAMVGAAVTIVCMGVVASSMANGGHESPPVTTQTNGHTPVTFCHKPGTPAEQELTTDDDGFLQGHLGHGDTLGPCQPTTTDETETTPDKTETTPTITETTPATPRCPPGMEPTAGKDGEPGNDECRYPPTTTTTTPTVTGVTATVTATTTPSTTTVTTTTPVTGPKPDAPPKPKTEVVVKTKKATSSSSNLNDKKEAKTTAKAVGAKGKKKCPKYMKLYKGECAVMGNG
jgi:hypothetical protein